MRHIALLRGINVGGNTMIKMAELKAAFEELGYANVATYINSGNLAFDSNRAETLLIDQIEEMIATGFGLTVSVMIRSREQIADVLANNPFTGRYESHKEMHVLFLKEPMPTEKAELLTAQNNQNERFAGRGREIYCHLRLGVADSLLGKGFIDRKLKVAATGRNWRTVERLVTL